MKKKLLCTIILMIAFLFVACQKSGKAEHNHEETNKAEITLRVALAAQKGESHYEAVMRFKEEVESKSEGKIEVSVLEAWELGGEGEWLELLANNEDKVDIVISDLANLEKYEPRVNLCELPFVFKDYDEVRVFMDGGIQAEAESGLLKHNMRVLARYANGFHCLITANTWVNTPKDLQGLRIATSKDSLSAIAMKAMGAQTKAVPVGEMMERLRQANFDGYEGTLDEIYKNHLYHSAKNLTVTNHSYSTSYFLIGEDVWGKLSKENQQIVEEAAISSSYNNYELIRQQEETILSQMESAGVRINRPSLNAFWEKSESVVRGYSSVYGDLTDKLAIWKNGRNERK